MRALFTQDMPYARPSTGGSVPDTLSWSVLRTMHSKMKLISCNLKPGVNNIPLTMSKSG